MDIAYLCIQYCKASAWEAERPFAQNTYTIFEIEKRKAPESHLYKYLFFPLKDYSVFS
jgi:hypothetical protein